MSVSLMCYGIGADTVAAGWADLEGQWNLVEAISLHSPSALQARVGGSLDNHPGDAAARALAVGGFHRAQAAGIADPAAAAGIGITASLGSDLRERSSRVHVAWQALDRTSVLSSPAAPPDLDSAQRNQLVRQLLLELAARIGGRGFSDPPGPALSPADYQEAVAPPAWRELLLGERAYVRVAGHNSAPCALFPGAFNPLHPGHKQMARLAELKLGTPVTFELSIVNVDKPPLDYLEIQKRLSGLAGFPVVLTRWPTFAEKAEGFPNCTFIVGVDTVERIGEPRFYGHSRERRDRAIDHLAGLGCRFLVFGRVRGDRFCGLEDVDLPTALRALCTEVPQSEFRQDVSSSEIRAAGLPNGD